VEEVGVAQQIIIDGQEELIARSEINYEPGSKRHEDLRMVVVVFDKEIRVCIDNPIKLVLTHLLLGFHGIVEDMIEVGFSGLVDSRCHVDEERLEIGVEVESEIDEASYAT
jgi:hypothetical protein